MKKIGMRKRRSFGSTTTSPRFSLASLEEKFNLTKPDNPDKPVDDPDNNCVSNACSNQEVMDDAKVNSTRERANDTRPTFVSIRESVAQTIDGRIIVDLKPIPVKELQTSFIELIKQKPVLTKYPQSGNRGRKRERHIFVNFKEGTLSWKNKNTDEKENGII